VQHGEFDEKFSSMCAKNYKKKFPQELIFYSI